MKKESVTHHKASAWHERALAIRNAQEKLKHNEKTAIEEGFSKMDDATLTKMDKLFRTAYYIAKSERPFKDFASLLVLQNLNGLSLGDTYQNDKAASEFISQISGSIFDELKSCLHNSDFISVYSDGSTDRAEKEKEMIMIRVLEDYYPKVKFLKLEEPENTKAEGILAAIDKAFSDYDMPDYKQKTVGFCSDGASVMMGCRKGVIKLLKDAGQAEWILPIHCFAHKLELAVKDCFKGSYMDTVTDTLTSIYYFYKGSAKRSKEAGEVAEILEESFHKPEKANGTRWVDHKLRAASKMAKNWKVIVIHLMSYSEDNSNRAEDRVKAKGIIRKVMQYKFVWFLHFLKDILNEVAKISLLYQREDINVSSAVTKLQSSNVSLRAMFDDKGEHLKSFENELHGNQYKEHTLLNCPVPPNDVFQSNENERKRLVQAVIDCLHSRFENIHEDQLFVSCHAFDHKNWPDTTPEALLQYGHDELNVLQNHFTSLLDNAGCDIDKAHSEWNDLKIYVSRNQHFRTVHPLATWQRISQEDSDRGDYANILKIIHLTSMFPLSNASCERAFSTMKRVKSDWRCGLNAKTLDQLVRISLMGPKLNEFNPKPAVRRWWLSGQRQKRPTLLPYGQRH